MNSCNKSFTRGNMLLLAFLSLTYAHVAFADQALLVRVGENGERKGVCRKLVITPSRGEEVPILDSAAGVLVQKAEPFGFYFMLKEDDKETVGKGEYYRVGNGLGKPVGYVHKDLVTKWDTMFCIEPYTGSGDAKFRVNLKGGEHAVYESSATTENVRCFVLSSDVKSKDIKDEDTPYEVLLYSGAARTANASPEEREADGEFDPTDTPLEIVFVIDTTASMEPLIEVAKKVAIDASEMLSAGSELQNANVAFGLVEYRDGQAGNFDARVVCKLTKQRNQFATALKSLSAQGGGDKPEAVGRGLDMAIDPAKVGWSERGNRQIVLLGDAPNKEEYGPKMDAIAARCEAAGNTDGVAALKRYSVQAIVNGDDSEAIDQFSGIAESTNKGGFFFKSIRAEDPSAPDVREASKELAEFLNVAFEASVALVTGDKSKMRDLADDTDNSVVQRSWEILSKNGNIKDTEELYHQGSASIRAFNGKKVGARKVLVLEPTLRRLGPALGAFVDNLGGQGVDELKNPELILELLQNALMRPITGDAATLRVAALKDIIANDLPIQTPSLTMTADNLSRMTNEDFEQWKGQVQKAATTADALVKESEWLGAGDAKYTFIELNKLP